MKFVRADGNQVRIELADGFKRLLAKPLHGVRVKNNSALAANRAQFGHRLDRADFIVGRHDGNQNRVRADRLFQIVHAKPGPSESTGSRVTSNPSFFSR